MILGQGCRAKRKATVAELKQVKSELKTLNNTLMALEQQNAELKQACEPTTMPEPTGKAVYKCY